MRMHSSLHPYATPADLHPKVSPKHHAVIEKLKCLAGALADAEWMPPVASLQLLSSLQDPAIAEKLGAEGAWSITFSSKLPSSPLGQ
jgi:hypothetical protein